jgi:hypothetical protein
MMRRRSRRRRARGEIRFSIRIDGFAVCNIWNRWILR